MKVSSNFLAQYFFNLHVPSYFYLNTLLETVHLTMKQLAFKETYYTLSQKSNSFLIVRSKIHIRKQFNTLPRRCSSRIVPRFLVSQVKIFNYTVGHSCRWMIQHLKVLVIQQRLTPDCHSSTTKPIDPFLFHAPNR